MCPARYRRLGTSWGLIRPAGDANSAIWGHKRLPRSAPGSGVSHAGPGPRSTRITFRPQHEDGVDGHPVFLRQVDDDRIAGRGRLEVLGLAREPGVEGEQ